jgi:predicted ferric reductase
MRRITLIFWVLCLGLTVLWLVADPVWSGQYSVKQIRLAFINYTGIVAMGAMAVSLLLALRSVAMEPYVGGLDKSYRLHKWLGVAALVMTVAHWTCIQTPPSLLGHLVTARPATGAAAALSDGLAALRALQGSARGVGQWCFYATVVLIVLALAKRFPYRHFIRTHRLLAIVYLLLVFHAVVLLEAKYWRQPVAYVLAALMAAGGAAAGYILIRKVGRTRQAVGEIDAVIPHQGGQIVEVRVRLKDRWPGHDAGQFAFVTFGDGEAQHPFTISSSWRDDGALTFLIKKLGDYTSTLGETLGAGSLVTVEGPYGRFTFAGRQERQIWVSAGIGITPFLSRMQELSTHPDGKIVDLFHATAKRDEQPLEQLRQLASAANVRLHLWVGAEEGRLSAAQVRRDIPQWQSTDVWFCGPVDFGRTFRREFLAAGLPASAFHQELFHLR